MSRARAGDRGRGGPIGGLLSALMAHGAWLFGPADFAIRRRSDGRVEVRGRIPGSKAGAIRAFFADDLGPAGPLTVRGSYGRGRAPRLHFAGSLTAGQRQRARNFLLEHLR
jgi:hypothetical protein